MKKWYYSNEGNEFNGFAHIEEDDVDQYEYGNGPFDTFEKAKKDAISRFTWDIKRAEKSLLEVKNSGAKVILRETKRTKK